MIERSNLRIGSRDIEMTIKDMIIEEGVVEGEVIEVIEAGEAEVEEEREAEEVVEVAEEAEEVEMISKMSIKMKDMMRMPLAKDKEAKIEHSKMKTRL
jgi:hypothetical protein